MQRLKFKPSDVQGKYVICSCEGDAERVIMDLLLDNDCLIFKREDLVGKSVTNKRKACDIEREFLNRSYGERGVVIVRILDSKSDKLTLKKIYQDKCKIYHFYTHPEIEILLLILEGEYQKYIRQAKTYAKPSIYCKDKLRLGRCIKSSDYWYKRFSDVNISARCSEKIL